MKEYGGERPFFAKKDLTLEDIRIVDGESGLKECSNITIRNCAFNGKYPLWHLHEGKVTHSVFESGSRAAIWYTRGLVMENVTVDAPKMFRRCAGISLNKVTFSDALETFWDCEKVGLESCHFEKGDYLFMNSHDLKIENTVINGNYVFQNCTNVLIRNCRIITKDAFWESKDVLVENCYIESEFLGWHSTNLSLVNCEISGSQPLCYADNLSLINCTMHENCNLCFEYSSVNASVKGSITSVKNPLTGCIEADAIGNVVDDENARLPHDCVIKIKGA